jgi:two-component sensor histidine kinase
MSFLKSWINAGVPKDDIAVSSEKIRVQNTFAVASMLLAIPLIFVFYFLDKWGVSLVFFGTTLVLLWSLLLNKRGKKSLSKFVIICIYSFILPVYSYLIGFYSGFYLYYAIAPALMLSIYDFNNKKGVLTGLCIALISLITALTLGYYFSEPYILLEADWINGIYWTNFIFNLAIISVLTFQLVLYHFKSVSEAKEINKRLRKNETTLKTTLNEKEVLLAEIHHRVKNNLAVLSGLMRLQIEETNNEEARNALERNAERIHSMAIIHNSLYQQEKLNDIDLGVYIAKLIEEIKMSYLSYNSSISIISELNSISISINKAIPCGIIINELLINAIKHAFPDKNTGEIGVTLKREDNEIFLIIADDGLGFLKNAQASSLGMNLIHSLSEQIDGQVSIESKPDDGTTVTLKFEVDHQ